MENVNDLKRKKDILLNAKNKFGLTIISSMAVLNLLSGCSNATNDNKNEIITISTSEHIDGNKDTIPTTKNVTDYVEPKIEKDTEYKDKDEIIINEFINERKKINDSYENDDKETLGKKAKQYFIKVVDFIFYDKEINGIKYNELKEDTKEVIYNELCETDEFIMEFAPNYKENISEKYEVVKDFTSKVYYSSLDKIKELIGEKKYDEVKEIKDNLKEKVKDLADKTKDKAKKYKLKLKDWYENYREN